MAVKNTEEVFAVKKRNIVMFALALVCVMGNALFAPAPVHASVLGETQVSFERAIQIAIGHAGGSGGVVTDVEWKNKHGRSPVYEIEIYRGGQKHEIRIDAVTGEIIRAKNKRTSKMPAGLVVSQVTSARSNELAATAVSRAGGGRVAEIDWEHGRNGTIVEIEVNNNGQKHEFRFNPATGEIIRHRSRTRSW